MPWDKILFFSGTRYGIMPRFKKSEECSCYSAIPERLEE